MKKTLIILCLLTLAGCDTEGSSPAYIVSYLNDLYANRPMNDFTQHYGYPADVFETRDGRRTYRWASTSYGLERMRAVPQRFIIPTGEYEAVDSYRGHTDRYYCELRIYTDAYDTIHGFAVTVDSTGKWSASRCSELFNPSWY